MNKKLFGESELEVLEDQRGCTPPSAGCVNLKPYKQDPL